MKVLSLFDGISCARVALDKAGIPVEVYYASEIDKYAEEVSKKNYPDIVRLGDVKGITRDMGEHWHPTILTDIDLLIGGSPCQDLSIAKKDRKGLDGERSGLFWDYVRILNEVQPKYFILENVASMPKEAKALITETLGVEPIMIDAALVSAQRRKRLFWTNIPVTLPEDREIFLRDILEEDVDEKYYIGDATLQNILEKMRQGKKISQAFRIDGIDGKSVTLSSGGGGAGAKTGLYCIASNQAHASIVENKSTPLVSAMGMGGGHVPMIGEFLVVPEATKKGYAIAYDGDSVDLSFPGSKTRRGRVGDKVKNLMTTNNINVFTQGRVRKLTPLECDRLQSLPDNYTEGISDSQRYKCLGNAFNAEVIAHILRFA